MDQKHERNINNLSRDDGRWLLACTVKCAALARDNGNKYERWHVHLHKNSFLSVYFDVYIIMEIR